MTSELTISSPTSKRNLLKGSTHIDNEGNVILDFNIPDKLKNIFGKISFQSNRKSHIIDQHSSIIISQYEIQGDTISKTRIGVLEVQK